jgi:hypothetical protein
MILSNDFVGVQPRQDLTAEEIEKLYNNRYGFYKNGIDAWYADNVRWGCGFYNINRRPWETNQNSYGSGPILWGQYGEAARAWKNFLYFQGDQSIADYGWLTQIDGGGEMIAPWNPGKEIRRFTKHVVNTYLKIARNSKPVVKSYDHKAQSKLKKKLDTAMIAYDYKPFFNELKEQHGIDFNPAGARDAANKTQIEKHFYQNATTTAEIYGTDIVNTVDKKQHFVPTCLRDFLYMTVGGRSMVECTKSNGWPQWNVIPSWCQVAQGMEDNDFGANDQVKGWVMQFSPQQIVTRQGMRGKTWGEQIKEKYGALALEKVLQGDRNYLAQSMPNWNGWGFAWYQTSSSSLRSMAVSRMYWKSLVDTRMLPHKEDPDNKIFFLSAKSKKKGTFVEIWRTATLIGNKYVVDEGVCDEVRDPLDESKLYCPIHTFQPYTYMGYANSMVDDVRAIQDDLSMLDFKFRDMVAYDLGIVLDILAAKGMGGTDAYAKIEELKKTRMMINEHSGDPDNWIDQKPMVTRIDMSTSKFANEYLDLWRKKEAMMMDILNISAIALGTQKTYVGFDTQQSTMDASSNNMQYNFYGHAQHWNAIRQYSLEQMKIMIASGETNAGDSIFGPRGTYFIKEMKDMLFGSLLCRVDIEDFIDDQRKKELLADLRVLMQTGAVDLVDLIKIENMQTWSEITSYVEWKYEARKTEAQGQAVFDKVMALIGSKQQAQATVEATKMQAEAGLAGKQIAAEANLAGKLIDHGLAPQEEQMAAAPAA